LAGELTPPGFESPEELREVILDQRRELDTLRRESDDAALMLDALGALLDLEHDEDPFAGVFAVLDPVFRFSHALVVSEQAGAGSPLRCIVASDPALEGIDWPRGRFFDKVLGGRVAATATSAATGDWPQAARDAGVSPEQPALCLPVGFRERRGLMLLLRPVGDPGFDRRDVALARKLSLLASHAFARRLANRNEQERRRLHDLAEELKEAQAQLAHRANYDLLTGLPNRAYFEEHMTRTLRAVTPGARLALAFIDLDGFKQVNDLYGHAVGDGLLAAVAERVRGQIRSSDMLARISGDEFVLLLHPVSDLEALDRVVARILAALQETFTIDRTALMVSGSIGVAVFPEHGRSYEELRRNADLAMYSAKSTARGSAAYFDAELGHAAARRTAFEQVLRRAVRERRFRSVLQPKVDLRTMQVTGFEALARRVDDDGRLRAPAEFIAPAAQLGLLASITDIILDEIIELMPALDAAYGDDTTISINISARRATDAETMRALLRRLADTGRPGRFVLELTEDALLHGAVFQREIVPLFREFGVRVSIDDFGTGYASLTTLLDITAHELKIDRAFICGVHERPRSQVIVQALAAASRALGVAIVAEGVETPQELRYLLAATPIETAQGYLFSRPLPAEALIAGRDELRARLAQLAAPLLST
jgi:diguanylate cyclase (GGDEF)-like protein